MRPALLLGLLLVSPPASAATWHVTVDGLGDASTIQAGIDSAAVGDTVLVGPGTYTENLLISGKDIVLRGEMGAAATVVDGTGLNYRGVQVEAGCTRACVVERLTISGHHIGVFILEAEPTLQDCVVTDNHTTASFGTILMGGNTEVGAPWSPLIQRNVVANNTAATSGPGIAVFSRMAAEIVENEVYGNSAGTGDGGGIYIRTRYDGTIIRDNRVYDNYAGDHGGGIYVSGLFGAIQLEIAGNLVCDNVADGKPQTGESGGGIWMEQASAWVHHNTIVRNTGNGPNSTYGGGIAMHLASSPIIEQNIIALTINGAGIFCHSGVTPTIRDNLGWQNQPVEGAGLCADWWQQYGNVIADPFFCGPEAKDFTVAADSPALTHPAGPLGAYPAPGCGPVPVEPTTWGRLKLRYGR